MKTPHRYFAFPELLSRVLNEGMKHPELGFSESDMRQLADRMMRVEAAYSQVFVPWVNPFSYQNIENLGEQPTSDEYKKALDSQPQSIDGRSRIYTPAMKANIAQTEGEVDPSVYIMFSGTGSAVEAIQAMVKAAHEAGIKAYSPPWEQIEGTEKMPPSVLADKNMLAVLGRSGWGTGWQAMQLKLPWLVAPYQKEDDPEIYFNNKTIDALRLGRIIGSEGINGDELRELASSVSPGLASLNQAVKDKFGTTDGIDFIASKIFEDLTKTTHEN